PRALYDDLRHAVRLIAANKTVSLAVFLSLTIGIGASASMFGAVDALLFRPLQVPQTGRIVRITSVTRDIPLGAISYPDFDDLRKRLTVFEGFATAQEVGAAVSSQNDGRSRITFGLVVNADFLRTLRVQPVLGRSFRPEEDAVPSPDA